MCERRSHSNTAKENLRRLFRNLERFLKQKQLRKLTQEFLRVPQGKDGYPWLCCTELAERAVAPVRIYSGNADANGLSKRGHAIERFNRDRNFGRTPSVVA